VGGGTPAEDNTWQPWAHGTLGGGAGRRSDDGWWHHRKPAPGGTAAIASSDPKPTVTNEPRAARNWAARQSRPSATRHWSASSWPWGEGPLQCRRTTNANTVMDTVDVKVSGSGSW